MQLEPPKLACVSSGMLKFPLYCRDDVSRCRLQPQNIELAAVASCRRPGLVAVDTWSQGDYIAMKLDEWKEYIYKLENEILCRNNIWW